MSAARKHPMTLDAFLDWESRQDHKYEFDGFGPVAMVGVSIEHGRIQRNLLGSLFNRLRGHRCEAIGSDVKIEAAGRIRYPDAFIVCTPLPRGTLIVHDPVVVFEIVSPGSAYRDRFEKNWEYRDTPSIQTYVILEQTHIAATVFSRNGADWAGHALPADAELAFPEIGITVPLADLYEGVTFPPEREEAET